MNWSDYSRFVGDVFGAPLAMEGLAAFFLESTFLGLWVFGWDRLPATGPPGDDLDARASGSTSRRSSSWRPTRSCSTRSACIFNPTHRPGRARQHRHAADQHHRAGDLPARHRRCLAGGRGFVLAVSRLAPRPGREDARRWTLPAGLPAGPGRGPGRGARRGRSPATAGPDHGRTAADEDGGRRGAVQHREGCRACRCSRSGRSTPRATR